MPRAQILHPPKSASEAWLRFGIESRLFVVGECEYQQGGRTQYKVGGAPWIRLSAKAALAQARFVLHCTDTYVVA